MPDPKIEEGVLYGWNPIAMEYYAVAGDGTEVNPFRPDSYELFDYLTHLSTKNLYIKFANEIASWEQESVKTGDTTEDISRKKKTIDMNKVMPEGATHVFTSNGDIIDGNDCTIKNFYITNVGNNPFLTVTQNSIGSSISNLNIVNAYFNNGQSTESGAIIKMDGGSGKPAILKNCKISIVINKHDQQLIYTGNNYPAYILNNSFNIRVVTPINSTKYIAEIRNNNVKITNNNFKLTMDIQNKKYLLFRGTSSGGFTGYTIENNKFNIYLYNDNYLSLDMYMTGDTGSAGGTTILGLFSNNVFKIKAKTPAASVYTGFTTLHPYDNSVYNVQGNWTNTNLINTNLLLDSNLSWNSNIKFPTDAQLVDKDWLIQMGFPIMYEDEG